MMTLRQRDKAILDDLSKFRVMSRDNIIDLHFSDVKNKVTICNRVLKRLVRDKYIEVEKSSFPYNYFPSPSTIKKNSQKINHFLAIVNFYKQLKKHSEPKQLIVESKYGKGMPEPDVFAIWQSTPFFVEIQCSIYSEKVMQEKMERYEKYFVSEEWHKLTWQPKGRKVFPFVWIITEHQYNIESEDFRIFQTRNVDELLMQVNGRGEKDAT
jgi:DNA-directed RNA polymerase specialized sigma54-like protein